MFQPLGLVAFNMFVYFRKESNWKIMFKKLMCLKRPVPSCRISDLCLSFSKGETARDRHITIFFLSLGDGLSLGGHKNECEKPRQILTGLFRFHVPDSGQD